ncbi:TIGR00159 family protein [Planctomycetales bacterium ZRK34]|nr:TIGR00159 family protein [Planctomycetales bacterium ZRK34]
MLDRLFQIGTRLQGYNPWEVLVQIALIWVVVYFVFRFLRGTRGARVLKGVGLLLMVAMILVAVLGPDASSFAPLRYLLDSFLGFAALALVIVFQPELRRGLVRLGEARLFRGAVMDMERVIDELVKAAEYLSKNKIGAIVAIERDVGLEGIVEVGTRLDAHVSAELLKTIFWPGSALHDMGVVIRGDEMVAAGVQFPLAEGGDLSQELGSRHRAALGLSQETDALVLVISEESGAMSLAERGQLLRKLSPDGLRAMLRRGLSQQGGGVPSAPSKSEESDAKSKKKPEIKPADKSAA